MSRMGRSGVVLCLVLACGPGAVLPASAQRFPGLPFDSRQFTFEVLSDNHLRLTGEVELDGDGWEFYADQVDFFSDDTRLVAVGNVVYVAEGARLAAERAEINTDDLTGIFYEAVGSVHMGDEAERSMFGSQEPDMHFFGETIEKMGPRTYRLSKGAFTSCTQPTPRWELRSGSFTINLDEYAFLKNTVLAVKGVPVFYLPVLYYPIQDDGRATGFLMPTYGTSTIRGTSLSNAFFWAIGRSHDATVFHDWFTSRGHGTGAEYRYTRGGGSEGFGRTYFLDESAGTVSPNGIETPIPARRSFEIRGNARQQITRNITARGAVNFFSDVTVQQTYHNNIFEASSRERSVNGNVSGTWGGYRLSGTFDANETFFGNRSATLWGGGPRISFGQGQRQIPGTPLYFSFDTEYVRLLRRTTFDPGGNETQINSGLHRADVNPVIQLPFTRWPFLTVNSSVAFRSTYWTERQASVGQVAQGISRNFADLQSRITGPSFVKIWDTPDSGYSERMKHVIEPFVNLRRVTSIDQFSEIVQLEGVDAIVGGVTQVTYGINNRMYARLAGGGQAGSAREILTVSLSQSYYSDARASQFDRNFSTSFNGTPPSNLSPVSLVVRADPTDAISASMRAEYDTKFKAIRTIGAEGTYDFRGLIRTTAGWSQRRFIAELPGFNNPNRLDHYLNAQTRVQNRSNTLGGAYQFNYDILRNRYLQQRVVAYYNAQCCGVSVEYQTFDFTGLGGRAFFPRDRRFNLSFTLAGLGTFSNVLGAFGAGDPQ